MCLGSIAGSAVQATSARANVDGNWLAGWLVTNAAGPHCRRVGPPRQNKPVTVGSGQSAVPSPLPRSTASLPSVLPLELSRHSWHNRHDWIPPRTATC